MAALSELRGKHLARYDYRTGRAIACNDYERVLCRIKVRGSSSTTIEQRSTQLTTRPSMLRTVTSVKLVEIRDCGSRRPDAVAPVEGCLPSVRLRAAIDGMADCAAGAVPLSSPAPDGAPLRGCGA